MPAKSVADLKSDKNITILPLKNWWIQIANPNTSAPPTDNLLVRKAIQAALDMDEIMDAASDGNYQLNVGFQYPNQPDYTDAGKETYNIHDPALAKKYLTEANYQGEPVVLLTNKDYPPMYNSALVMQQQLQAVGINAQMKVVDWPTSVQMWQNTSDGWNFHFTRAGARSRRLVPLATMQFLVQPKATYKPKGGKDDPDVLAAWNDMNTLPTPEGRQEAFARMQKLVLERVYAVPFGSFTKVQAVRSNVQGLRAVPHPAHGQRLVCALTGPDGRGHRAAADRIGADPSDRQPDHLRDDPLDPRRPGRCHRRECRRQRSRSPISGTTLASTSRCGSSYGIGTPTCCTATSGGRCCWASRSCRRPCSACP